MRSLATATVLLLALLGACGDGGSDSSDTDATDPATSSSAPSDPVTSADPVPTESATGEPKTDPCDLLTKGMAEAALGVPVGKPKEQAGEGNLTCYYTPADGTKNVYALLTTYAASGEKALMTATSEFPDAKRVPDLGDAAIVSRQGHAIGVAVDDLIFAISILKEDSLTEDPAVVEAQLVTLASTVVDAR
jgi:hypothetical protein